MRDLTKGKKKEGEGDETDRQCKQMKGSVARRTNIRRFDEFRPPVESTARRGLNLYREIRTVGCVIRDKQTDLVMLIILIRK